MEYVHKSVLLKEAVDALNVQSGGIYVDGTAGGGGHSFEIASRLCEKSSASTESSNAASLQSGRLIAIDKDPSAIQAAGERLKAFDCVTLVRADFSEIKEVLFSLGISGVDGVLLDVGVSSPQLDTPERGFSYHHEAPLDMRMSGEGASAYDLVNKCSPAELTRIISVYGEEKFAKSIVREIMRAREKDKIETTTQLAEIVKSAYPAKARQNGHPARKTFQAIRIAVNGELDKLSGGIQNAFDVLNPGGRLAVITFHSLEDRIVKRAMAQWKTGCTCPSDFPVCVCGGKPKAKLVTNKPIEPSRQELEENPRARSAKLRACEKLP